MNMRAPMHPIRILIVLPLCLLAVAAAAEPTAAGDGLVAVRVVGHGYVPRTLTLKPIAGGKTVELPAAPAAVLSTAVFAGPVPAGRYRIETLRMAASLPGKPAARDDDRSAGGDIEAAIGGEFEVRPAKLTDLRTLAYMPAGEPRKEPGADRRRVDLVFMLDRTAVRVGDLPLLDGEQPWAVAPHSEQPAPFRAAAAKRFPVLWGPTLGAGGAFLAGGRMGQVVRIHADGRRQEFDTGVVHEIHAVRELADGRWIAGGEEGFLGVSSDAGKTWRHAPGLPADGLVMHIAESMGAVHATVQLERATAVFKAIDKDLQRWTEVFRTSKPPAAPGRAAPEPMLALRDNVVQTADRLVIYARDEQVHSMDFATGRWQSERMFSPHHKGTSASDDGLVVGNGILGFKFATLDYGKSWYRFETFTWASESLFANQRDGIMVASPVKLMGGLEWTLYSTADGGRNWAKAGRLELEDLTWSFSLLRWMDKERKTIAMVFPPHGLLMVSADGGRSWRASTPD